MKKNIKLSLMTLCLAATLTTTVNAKGNRHETYPFTLPAGPAGNLPPGKNLNLIINRHFFRLHHLAFDLIHRQPRVA